LLATAAATWPPLCSAVSIYPSSSAGNASCSCRGWFTYRNYSCCCNSVHTNSCCNAEIIPDAIIQCAQIAAAMQLPHDIVAYPALPCWHSFLSLKPLTSFLLWNFFIAVGVFVLAVLVAANRLCVAHLLVIAAAVQKWLCATW